jgi:hypothetical protein
MKKIKLECWWTNSNSLNHRFKKQFVYSEEGYEFVESNPDYTIIFGKTDWDKIETPKERTFYISQEPLWSPNQPKDDIHNYCSKIFISDKREYPDRDEYIEVLLPMFYAGRGEFDSREEWDWSYKMFHKDFEKNKCVSMVVTNNYNSHFSQLSNPETSRIIYKERSDLSINCTNNLEFIDIWGTFQGNNNKNLHGEAWNKLLALREFKFSICAENTVQKNYITEKFWDCVITDTIPIYFGCNNIDEYIDNDCYINLTKYLDDYTLIENKLKFIYDNCDLLYKKYLPSLKKLKLEFKTNSNFNLWEFIKKQIET